MYSLILALPNSGGIGWIYMNPLQLVSSSIGLCAIQRKDTAAKCVTREPPISFWQCLQMQTLLPFKMGLHPCKQCKLSKT